MRTIGVSEKEAARVAREAAKKIEQYGWATGTLFAQEGVCLLGAVVLTLPDGKSMRAAIRAGNGDVSDRAYGLPGVKHFARKFSQWLGRDRYWEGVSGEGRSVDFAWYWNDGMLHTAKQNVLTVAPPDTMADVLAALDKFASEMDPGGGWDE